MIKNKTIYVVRAIPVEEHGRAMRYINFFNSNNIDVKIIQWGGKNRKNVYSFILPRYRGMPFLNAILTPLFSTWVFIFLLFNIKKDMSVLAFDLDTGLPAYVAKKIINFKLIYDIADPYSLCRFNKNIKVINKIESIVARESDIAIVPGNSRTVFYDPDISFSVIENVPIAIGNISSKPCNKKTIDFSSFVNIGYMGNLEPNVRLLEDLTSVILARKDIVLHIAGNGGLYDFFQEKSMLYPDIIKFYGKYSNCDMPFLMEKFDILFAAYSIKKEHHQYIESNKSYEHLLFGKCILTNNGTNLSKKIISWKTGWCFDENKESLDQMLTYISSKRNKIEEKSNNARYIWINNYSTYWNKNEDISNIINFVKK